MDAAVLVTGGARLVGEGASVAVEEVGFAVVAVAALAVVEGL